MIESDIKYCDEEFDNRLSGFSQINLEELNRASLMNRVDYKFILNKGQLNRLIKPLSDSYYILKINNQVNHAYTSIYFDTLDLDMYLDHHNRRVNRYKIRQRIYHSSGDKFLEIKFKNNKGFTRKLRTGTRRRLNHITLNHFEFILSNTPYHPLSLRKVLMNNFNRFTLTNEKRNQRITIDTNISFCFDYKSIHMDNLVVAEVKSVRNDVDKTIFQLLRDNSIHSTSISKYSIGLAILNKDVKQNLFKQKINSINKVCHTI